VERANFIRTARTKELKSLKAKPSATLKQNSEALFTPWCSSSPSAIKVATVATSDTIRFSAALALGLGSHRVQVGGIHDLALLDLWQ